MAVRLLETTIRDGGYEISHQFTEEDVALVVSTLEAAGIGYIEIGYGMGVGAQRFPASHRPKARPVADDRAHMTTGCRTARRAKIGVLFGAGDIFCPPDYLDEVAAAGMNFVRLAFMPNDITPANMRYVERARALGLTVSINCMQTYILPPREIARLAAMCHKAGADWWYVVDSAGGMQPDDVRSYVRAVLDTCDMQVGLHAHNNLGLAVANSLAAVDAGATLVDCTVNGIGRATGNAPTEQLLLALQARGHETEVDVEPIARLSSLYRRLFEGKGNDPMHVVSGASMLHSRNLPAVIAEGRKRGLSVADFMVRVGREARKEGCLARFTFPPEVFERAARGCKQARASEASEPVIAAIAARLEARAGAGVAGLCEDLTARAARHHLPSVLHLVAAPPFPFDGPLPWQSASLVGVSARADGTVDLPSDRLPDYLVVDSSVPAGAPLPPCRVRRLTCAWEDLWLDAIRAAVAACAAGGAAVWLPATGDALIARAAERLRAAGLAPSDTRPSGAAVTLAASGGGDGWVAQLAAGDRVVLVDRGPSARALADAIRRAGAEALAPPIGAVIAARVHELISLSDAVAALGSGAGAAWVEPLLAPGSDQAVADPDLSAIVELGPRPRAEVAAQVASARASALASGRALP